MMVQYSHVLESGLGSFDPKQRLEKFRKMKDKCDCCGKSFREAEALYPIAEHSHYTGHIRGLTCQKCNTKIGLFEKPFSKAKGLNEQEYEMIKRYLEKFGVHGGRPYPSYSALHRAQEQMRLM